MICDVCEKRFERATMAQVVYPVKPCETRKGDIEEIFACSIGCAIREPQEVKQKSV